MSLNPPMEISDSMKIKVESYDIDSAIAELHSIVNESSVMYHQLKQVKYDYLVQICELYSRIDFPSIMMDTCRKEIVHNIPKAKDIDRMEFGFDAK